MIKQHVFKGFSCYAFCLLLVWGYPMSLHAQSYVDSIFTQHTDKKGKVDVSTILIESRNFIYTQPKEAFAIAQRGLKTAEKQKEPLQIAQSLQALGTCYFQINEDYATATEYYQRAEKHYDAMDSKEGLKGKAMVYHNLGTIEQVEGDYGEAIQFYIKTLKLFDQAGEKKLYAHTLSNISTLYGLVGNVEKSEKYARECIAIARKEGDEFMVATGSLNLASALQEAGRYPESLAPLQEVLEYGKKAKDPYKIILYHVNYGEYLLAFKKDYPAAIKELEKAKELAESIDDEWEVMRESSALSEAYLKNNELQKAYDTAEKTLLLAKKMKAKDKIEIALSVMAEVNARNAHFETAYEQLQTAYLYKDSLNSEHNKQTLAYLETEYQTEKKEFKIQTLEKQQLLYLWLGITALLMVLTLFAFGYMRYRLAVSQRKLTEQKNQRLEKEQQLAATQALLQGQEDERSRMAKELHDGLGGLLSGAKLNLNNMDKKLIISEADGASFEKSIHLLDQSINELRRVAHNLMPESILKFGLDGAVREFLQSIHHDKLNVTYQSYHIENGINKQLDISVYRIIQELVNNVMKHAAATEMLVQIRKDEHLLMLDVEDNGKGIHPESTEQQSGMGLAGIRSRVNYWNGTLQIDSSKNKGTSVHIEIPF